MTSELTEVHLKPHTLAHYGLPDIAYPLHAGAFAAVMNAGGVLPFGLLLHGLQQHAAEGKAPWRALEPAMQRLADLLSPADDRFLVVASGDDWWLEIGPVDLDQRIVTVQRDDCLIAAVCAREDGRLRAAVFHPLDAKSAGYLVAAGQLPDPVYGVAMRENNWEYLLDGSSSSAHYYAFDRGEAHLSRWDHGIGIQWDGAIVPDWRAQRTLVPCRAAMVAAQLVVHSLMSEAP